VEGGCTEKARRHYGMRDLAVQPTLPVQHSPSRPSVNGVIGLRVPRAVITAKTAPYLRHTPHGPRTCFEARTERPGRKPLVARFGGIPLKRQKRAVLDDRLPVPAATRRKELVTRLLKGRCEWCQQRDPVQVHQVRKLADLGKPGPAQPGWASLMARMRRKTLIVCAPCHQLVHDGKPAAICTP